MYLYCLAIDLTGRLSFKYCPSEIHKYITVKVPLEVQHQTAGFLQVSEVDTEVETLVLGTDSHVFR